MRIAVLLVLALLAVVVPAAALPAGSANVSAVGLTFVPQAVTVPVGGSVTWNGVLLPHTVTSAISLVNAAQGQGDEAFDRGLPQGGSVTLTFVESGIYSYFCALHHRSGMVGTVIVE